MKVGARVKAGLDASINTELEGVWDCDRGFEERATKRDLVLVLVLVGVLVLEIWGKFDLDLEGNGVLDLEGNGVLVLVGNGVLVLDGNGVLVLEGNGVLVLDGNGVLDLDGSGFLVLDGVALGQFREPGGRYLLQTVPSIGPLLSPVTHFPVLRQKPQKGSLTQIWQVLALTQS